MQTGFIEQDFNAVRPERRFPGIQQFRRPVPVGDLSLADLQFQCLVRLHIEEFILHFRHEFSMGKTFQSGQLRALQCKYPASGRFEFKSGSASGPDHPASEIRLGDQLQIADRRLGKIHGDSGFLRVRIDREQPGFSAVGGHDHPEFGGTAFFHGKRIFQFRSEQTFLYCGNRFGQLAETFPLFRIIHGTETGQPRRFQIGVFPGHLPPLHSLDAVNQRQHRHGGDLIGSREPFVPA